MSKKKKAAVAALIVLGIVAVGLAAGVYAKYIASLTANGGQAVVAKWAFESDNESKTVSCNLSDTYTASTLVNGKIAPGTSGVCKIQLVNTNSDVAVRYTVRPVLDNNGKIANQPSNLKLYTDANHQNALTTTGVSGDLTPNQSNATEVSIYWEWKYETGDSVTSGNIVDSQKEGDVADTNDGKDSKTMAVSFEVQGIQIQPSAQ